MDALMNAVHCIDALELLTRLEPQSVDAIITDLPYGTTACSWDNIIPFEPMWAGVKRVLKPRGVFVTTASQPFTSVLINSNFSWFKYCWVWVKSNIGDPMNAKNRPMKAHEDIVIFSPSPAANVLNKMNYYPQGLKAATIQRDNHYGKDGGTVKSWRPSHKPYVQGFTGYPNTVLEFSNDKSYHPTQKPVALYDYLIRTYTQAGDLVVDFCCGSGTTAVAAATLNRRFIAGDTSAEYCAIARKRLETITPDMFELCEVAHG